MQHQFSPCGAVSVGYVKKKSKSGLLFFPFIIAVAAVSAAAAMISGLYGKRSK
jgi:hypothetical protein